MSRRDDREAIFSLLFEYSFYEDGTAEEIISRREEGADAPYGDFVRTSFLDAVSNCKTIDEKIASFAEGWKISRMSKATISVLRLAVYELLYTDTPPKVVINEAVELTKKYDEKRASSFVNGILNKLARGEGLIADAPSSKDE
ncbi:MAG: transcription antitermination factor NusB [Clostridia bacterium]|nr:transcription antitermination factor NusB [Clostridia bacterium]